MEARDEGVTVIITRHTRVSGRINDALNTVDIAHASLRLSHY